jgi:hypothetical protein
MLRVSLLTTLLSFALLVSVGCSGAPKATDTGGIKPKKPTRPKPVMPPAATTSETALPPAPPKRPDVPKTGAPVAKPSPPPRPSRRMRRAAEPKAAPPPTGVVATGGPALSFSFSPKKAKAGAKVTLTLSAPVGGVEVFFDGDELTATSKQGGKVLVVTVPKDASSGYLELRVNGQTFKAAKQLEVQ